VLAFPSLLPVALRRWSSGFGRPAANPLNYLPVTDSYRNIVGGTRDCTHSMHGTQDADPYRASRAIERALEAEKTPLSLQFGTDAVASVRAHAEQLLKDLAAWERVAADMRIGSDVLAQIAVERDTFPSPSCRMEQLSLCPTVKG
jgi:hypothetical protein